MPQYEVRFADASGRIATQRLEAASERAVVSQLESAGKTPISVTAAAAGKQRASSDKSGQGKVRLGRSGGGRGTRRAVLDFTHQLAAVVESGIPIISGLKAVGEQTGHPELRSAIARIAGRIEGGRSLADAMDVEPVLFPPIYVKTVAAGEVAGKVPEVLLALARYQEQEQETRGQIKSALLYPSLVVVALMLATAMMLVFVVPQFAAMFEKFNGKLPLPTRILLAASGAVTHHYFWVMAGLIGSYFLTRRLVSLSFVRAFLDERLLRLPVFGNLLLGVYMVRFIELLDLLMRAALPITQSLRVTADSMTNASLKRDVRAMLRDVEGGRSLTEAFSQTKWLTPLVKRMLAIGEQAGRTDQIFSYLKKYYATQTARSVKLLSTLVEPILVTGLASVVLFFALAIFLPMWKLLKIVGTA
ncbi:Type II secretion system protein F [Phycisphaerae bacterium RAS2]|nr:Type II secretion system protein F [Phycisphaerae bacterium RAS2]